MCIRAIPIPLRIIAAIAGAAGALAGATGGAHENHAPLPTKGVTIQGDQILVSAKGREAIGMTLAKVTLGDLRRVIQASARVELPWRQQAMISSPVPGKVEQVLAPSGESVVAGQELTRVVSMELQSLQADLLQAVAEATIAERLMQQRTALDEQGVAAGKSLLEAKAALVQKRAQLEIANQKLLALGFTAEMLKQVRASGQMLRSMSITSPIGGVITHSDVRVGQTVAPTDHLYHVVNLSTLWVVGEALEADVAHLRKGQEVVAHFAAAPGQSLTGQVDHVRLTMDQKTRTQAVVVAVDNQAGLLRPGMFGRVDIEVQVAKQAIFCPTDALIETRAGAYVLVERGEGKYVNQAVKLGLRSGARVEILDGLFPGDRVVVVGNYLLASLMGNEHKARVTPDPAGAPPAKTAESESSDDTLLVAQATVELPTDRQVFATSPSTGRIARICVDPSQPVRAGQVLAEVDSLALRNLQLDLVQAALRARWIEQSLLRLKEIGGAGGSPKRQVWQLENDLTLVRQSISSLQHKLTFLGLNDAQLKRLQQAEVTRTGLAHAIVTRVQVTAPADGWIVGFSVLPGQVVQPQDKLFEIHDLSKVWARGYVFEQDASRVRVGQQAQVTFSAYPDLAVTGTVIRTSPELESSERVLPVWIEVDNPDLRLKQGMLARVAVSTKSASAAGRNNRGQ